MNFNDPMLLSIILLHNSIYIKTYQIYLDNIYAKIIYDKKMLENIYIMTQIFSNNLELSMGFKITDTSDKAIFSSFTISNYEFDGYRKPFFLNNDYYSKKIEGILSKNKMEQIETFRSNFKERISKGYTKKETNSILLNFEVMLNYKMQTKNNVKKFIKNLSEVKYIKNFLENKKYNNNILDIKSYYDLKNNGLIMTKTLLDINFGDFAEKREKIIPTLFNNRSDTNKIIFSPLLKTIDEDNKENIFIKNINYVLNV